MARTRAHEKYLTATPSGTRVQIRIKGVLHRKHFKRGTDPVIIKRWLLDTEVKYRGGSHGKTGRFCDDATVYLAAVASMPTYAERKAHIDEWIAVFGKQLRDTITAEQIRAQLHAWRQTKAASTVNHRRTALMHLFRVLDGKAAANPVKDAPKFSEPSPFPRAVSAAAIAKLIAAIPPGPDRARAMVLAYAGIPHAQIHKIEPSHVDVKARTVIVHGRRKGQGTAASVRRLTRKGAQAFQMMKRTKAWGPFSRWDFRKVILAACEQAKIDPPLRPYDLRHFFGTELYRRSGDMRAVQVLMGHSTPALTHRYTLGATDPRVEAAIDQWDD